MILTTEALKPLIQSGKAVFTIKAKTALDFLHNYCQDVTGAKHRHATYKAGKLLFIKVPEKLTTANVKVSFKKHERGTCAHYIYFTNSHRIASHTIELKEVKPVAEVPKNTVYIAANDRVTIETSIQKLDQNAKLLLMLRPF